MKAKRLLFLVIAICLVGGVKAQFYDGPDDIYYYVEYENGSFVELPRIAIFNFDGQKGALLNKKDGGGIEGIVSVRDNIKSNPNYYDEQIENVDYNMYYIGSQTYTIIVDWVGRMGQSKYSFKFSPDRQNCHLTISTGSNTTRCTLKRVSKSYFKSGRSRTPSGTLYE